MDALKTIKVKFEPDEVAYRKIEASLDKFKKFNIFSEEDAKLFDAQLKKAQDIKMQIAAIESAITFIEDLGGEEITQKRKELEATLGLLNEELIEITGNFEEQNAEDKGKTSKEKTSVREVIAQITDTMSDTIDSFASEFENSNSKLGKTIGKLGSTLSNTTSSIGKLLDGNLDGLTNILNSAVSAFASVLAGGIDELDNISRFSTLSDEQTRELYYNYGLSGASAYGVTKAAEVTGIKSEDDFYAMIAENGVVLKEFQKAFDKYSTKYNEALDSGTFEQMLEFNSEMAQFEEDIKLEVVNFFMENKEMLRDTMTKLLELSDFLLDGLVNVFRWLDPTYTYSSAQRSAMVSEVVGNSTVNNSSMTVTIDNTFNNVAKEDQTWLAHAGQMTYEQVVRALEG